MPNSINANMRTIELFENKFQRNHNFSAIAWKTGIVFFCLSTANQSVSVEHVRVHRETPAQTRCLMFTERK